VVGGYRNRDVRYQDLTKPITKDLAEVAGGQSQDSSREMFLVEHNGR